MGFFSEHCVIFPSKSSFTPQIQATEETTKAQNFKQPRKIPPLDQLCNLSFDCKCLLLHSRKYREYIMKGEKKFLLALCIYSYFFYLAYKSPKL